LTDLPDIPMTDDTLARLDARVTELEIKASFAEDLVDRLNEVVVTQQRHIEALLAEVRRLREEARSDEPTTFRSLREEIPPHY
jgi:SlyX protein